MTNGHEPNQPNTISTSICTDGNLGSYHGDESLEAITISTVDGSALAPGKTARVDVNVWAYSNGSSDYLDLYYSASVTNPVWQHMNQEFTMKPAGGGSQNLTAYYVIPAGTLQVVRGVFGYGASGNPNTGPCSPNNYTDHDDLVFATATDGIATYDANYHAPRCASASTGCSSGGLLASRGSIPTIAEQHAPNTIAASTCSDGNMGTYQHDESIESIAIATVDGSGLLGGKTVRVDVAVFAYQTFTADYLYVYYAANASNPAWTQVATLQPTASGQQTLSATFVLARGTNQVVRASFGYHTAAGTCTNGNYDDHDDLVFTAG